MSRFTVKLEAQKEFVYGFDHALGYFYELWDYSLGKEDDECLLEDKSYLFNKLSKIEMAGVMTKYRVNEEHIEKVFLDLSF